MSDYIMSNNIINKLFVGDLKRKKRMKGDDKVFSEGMP